MLIAKGSSGNSAICPVASTRNDSFLIVEGRMAFAPEDARLVLDQMNYKRQRRIERSHVAVLIETLLRGRMIAGSQIAFGKLPDGSLHLLNGQHRLAAVYESGIPVEFQVLFVPCASEEELDIAYYRFDTVQRKRSHEMVLRASGIYERQHIKREVARGAYEAGVIIACGLRRLQGSTLPARLKTPDGRLAAIEPFWPQVRQYQDLIEKADQAVRRRMKNGSVVAVALLTLRDQLETAEKFWRGVAENDGLAKGDPRRTLMLGLSTREYNTLDTGLIFCANAWNAWFSGRSLSLLKALPGSEPVLRGVKMPKPQP